MSESAPETPGFFTSLRQMGDTLLAIVQNRLELAGLEWEEEKRRAVIVMLASVCLLLVIIMGMLVITGLFLAAFWEQRVLVLTIFSVLYIAIALALAILIKRETKKPMFDETITQLKKDRQWLFPRS